MSHAPPRSSAAQGAGGRGEVGTPLVTSTTGAKGGGKGAELRLSASLVLLSPLKKRTSDGYDYKVLLLRRRKDGGTYEGAQVFPGGNLDPSDSLPSLLRYLPSLPPSPYPSSRSPTLLHSLALCALRETFEEAGLLLLSGSNSEAAREARERWAGMGREQRAVWRERVHRRAGEMEGLMSVLGGGEGVLAGEGLREWGRWITPVGLPRRFDTTFFLSFLPSSSSSSSSSAPPAHTVTADGSETVQARWFTPGEAVRRGVAYTRSLSRPASEGADKDRDSDESFILHPPQFNLLAELALHKSYSSLLLPPSGSSPEDLVPRARPVPAYLPRLVRFRDLAGQERRATVLPGDEAYGAEPAVEGEKSWEGAHIGNAREGEKAPGQGEGKRRWNRTYVMPLLKGKSGLTVEGVHREGMLDILGEGWEDMRAGDVGEDGEGEGSDVRKGTGAKL
ncbi:hypothetical protein JCM10213_000097 [Rhodosporidiobolus nylandii]